MGRVKKGSKAFRTINLAFFTAGFVTFVTLYDAQPLLPVFSTEYRVSAALSSLPLSITTLAVAFTMLLAGTLSESWGRKRTMVLSVFITALLALITPLTSTFPQLLGVRLVQGMVLAGLPAVAMAYLGEEMEPASLSAAMGLYIAGNAVGGMTGRIFTATVTDLYSWRVAIGAIGCITVGLSFLFARTLPQSANFTRRPFNGTYLVTSLVRHLRDPGMVSLYLIAFLLTGSFVAVYNYLSFRLLAPPYHFSHTMVSWLFLVYLVGSWSSASVGRVAERIGRGKTLCGAIATMAVGAAITLAQPTGEIICGMAVFTAGFFAAHATASSWVSARAQVARAQASSLYLFSYYMGSSVAGTVGGFFWTMAGWGGVIGMICILEGVALMVAAGISRSSEVSVPSPAFIKGENLNRTRI